ncbi:MAG TPA: DUF3313 family protein, partial [Smithella sp.]|nr:DUF3313 family protein [Smithella sp.]
ASANPRSCCRSCIIWQIMILDSMTNKVLGVAVDKRAAGFTERFSKWGSAEEAFKFWADRMVKFIDSEKTIWGQ